MKLFRDAIADYGIDPGASVFVGDRWRDVAPATALGGRPIFLDVASSPPADRQRVRAEGLEVAHSLGEAVDRFLDALPAPSGGQ